MTNLPAPIAWAAVVGTLAVIGLVVLVVTTRRTNQTRRDVRRRRIAEFISSPAAVAPERTGSYLNGRVDRLTEGIAVVALTGPGNGGQRVLVPDTGQYVVGDRVTLHHYSDDTWRPEVNAPVWDPVVEP